MLIAARETAKEMQLKIACHANRRRVRAGQLQYVPKRGNQARLSLTKAGAVSEPQCSSRPVLLVANMSSAINVRETYGAYMLGVILSACLYGITVVQTYTYYRRSPRDPMYLKYIIFSLWIFNTMHEVFLIQTAYFYLIISYGNPLAITVITWTYWAALVMSSIIEFIVKGLFCWRLLKLGKRWRLIVPIAFFSICRLAGVNGASGCLNAFLHPSSRHCSTALVGFEASKATYVTGNTLNDLFYWTIASGVVGDILLAVAQAVILWNWRTGFKKTNNVVWTLMMYTINTCALTSVVDLVQLITFAVFRNSETLIYVAVYHQLPALYLNAILATYNAREELREAVHGRGAHITIPLSELPSTQLSETYAARSNDVDVSRTMQISIQKSTHTMVDKMADKTSSVHDTEDGLEKGTL
ncbi:hypothetical protein CERSUDRAFT_115380 [Gelatoporia subvermispora B]|uniref:DUF6534 domain-containing protein n=1 Tax=Ceriporiopsis subvermispora (strain B) TaxID=914234 RepID=M2PJL1_CERS8|nr:hypothetical protein CERSUDRAFT_115380 [Gelatoporia subvermispora B]